MTNSCSEKSPSSVNSHPERRRQAAAPPSRKQKPKPAEQGQLTPTEDKVEIVNDGGILKFPGESAVPIIPSQEVRNSFPVQLSQYYEEHIHFL
jgi:hypothetical protein